MVRRFAPLLVVALAVLACPARSQPEPPVPMARYVFGLLRRGPRWTPERNAATELIQKGHLENIRRMAEQGALLAAGPFVHGDDLRGVLIFKDDTLSNLRARVGHDPAVRAGRLVLDLYPWYAPAGIGRPYFQHWKEPGHRDSMVTLQMVLLRTGPKWTTKRTPEVRTLEKQHMENVFALLRSGKAALAGPVEDADGMAGVFVFRGDSAGVAELIANDPMVRAGRMRVEHLPWMAAYGTMPGDTL